MVRENEQLSFLGTLNLDGSSYSDLEAIEEHEDPWGSLGYVDPDDNTTDRIKRQQSRLESRADPEIVGQLRAVTLDTIKAGLRLFMLWSPAEGKTDRELRERFSKAKRGGLPLDSYSRNYFGRYALAMRFVARERCPEYLNRIREEQERFQYIR